MTLLMLLPIISFSRLYGHLQEIQAELQSKFHFRKHIKTALKWKFSQQQLGKGYRPLSDLLGSCNSGYGYLIATRN